MYWYIIWCLWNVHSWQSSHLRESNHSWDSSHPWKSNDSAKVEYFQCLMISWESRHFPCPAFPFSIFFIFISNLFIYSGPCRYVTLVAWILRFRVSSFTCQVSTSHFQRSKFRNLSFSFRFKVKFQIVLWRPTIYWCFFNCLLYTSLSIYICIDI